MKKVIIIHGWESSPVEHWYQEEKQILIQKGFEVLVPEMLGGSFVKEEEWVRVLADSNPDAETVLIGHSLGAPTILRFLESSSIKVDRVILIAGFASLLNLDYPNADYPGKFVERPFNWEKIKSKANKFLILNQDNDPWVPFAKGEELAQNLSGELVEVKGSDHFDKMDLDLINKGLH